jgi:hypothetical protein
MRMSGDRSGYGQRLIPGALHVVHVREPFLTDGTLRDGSRILADSRRALFSMR